MAAHPMRTYEITWANGTVERFEAQYTSYPSARNNKADRTAGMGHITFMIDYAVVLSIREADVTSVRFIPITVLEEIPDGEGQGQEG